MYANQCAMPGKHELKDRTHTWDKSLVQNAIAIRWLVRSLWELEGLA